MMFSYGSVDRRSWLISIVLILQCVVQSLASASWPSGSPSKTSFVSTAPSGTVTSFYSWQTGPFIGAVSLCWSRAYIPTVVGTIFVTVDQIHNTTITNTVYNTEIKTNGSLSIFSRTDTNTAGTVTEIAPDNQTMTYPTGYVHLASRITWEAILPHSEQITVSGISQGTCCNTQSTYSPAPPHTGLVGKVQTIDSADPSGWEYKLGLCSGFPDRDDPQLTTFSPTAVSSIFYNYTLSLDYDGCPWTQCPYGSSVAGLATGAAAVVSIFASSTTTLSSSSTPTKTPTTSPSPKAQSEVLPSTSTTPPTPQTTPTTTPANPPAPSPTTSSANAPAPSPATTPANPPAPSPATTPNNPPPPSPNTSANNQPPANPPATTSPSVPAQNPTTAAAAPPPPPPPSPPAPITVGSSVITANSQSQFIVGSQTLNPGSSITVSGSVISAPPVAPAPASTLPPLTVGSSVITANSASQFIVGGQTLQPGSSITVSGSVVSAPVAVPVPAPASTLPAITVGSSVITANSASQFIIGGQTLNPGSSITVSGSVISAPAAIPVPPPTSTLPPITVGSSTITPNSASQYIVGGQTLKPGSSITVSGSVISYPTPVAASLPPITVGGSVVTPSASKYVFGSQTLAPGSSIVVSGTTLSLAPGGSKLVIGGSTNELLATASSGPGGYIWSALANPTGTATAGTGSGSSGTGTSSLFNGDATQLSGTGIYSALLVLLAVFVQV